MPRVQTIGIVGGMSPESTVTYYQRIVRRHQLECGDHDYPRIVVASVSFGDFIQWQHEGAWGTITKELEREFDSVAAAGADFALLATNTMHKVLPDIRSPIPVLSILDAVSRCTKRQGIRCLGLTGTKFTMSDGFYAEGLETRGIAVVVPPPTDQDMIHRIIYEELIAGRVERSSGEAFSGVCRELSGRGAQAVLLGCTELGLLAEAHKPCVATMDSATIHADEAWERAMGRASG
jgi:aspartate racemase